MDEKPEKLTFFQDVALAAVCKLYGMPVLTFGQLESIERQEGPEVRIETSSWKVVEARPNFDDQQHAIDVLSRSAERAHVLAERLGFKVITYSLTESIIDIRFDMPGGQGYRIRIYSPVTEKSVPDQEEGVLAQRYASAYEAQFGADELTLPLIGRGYLISISKDSEEEEGDESSYDDTSTFLLITKKEEGDGLMEIEELQRIVNAILDEISKSEQIEEGISSVRCKYRTALNMSTSSDADTQPIRWAYLACDHRGVKVGAEDLSILARGDNTVDLKALLEYMLSEQLSERVIEYSGEIEINRENPALENVQATLGERDPGKDAMDFVYSE